MPRNSPQNFNTQMSNQEQLYPAATKLLHFTTLEENYNVICQESLKLVDGKYASIFIPDKDRLVRIYSTDPILYHVTPRKKGDIYQVYTTKTPHIFGANRIAKNHPAFGRFKVGNVICIPLMYQKHAIGVLSVLSKKQEVFTKKDLDTLRLLGPLASLAINNARIFERLQQSIEDRNLFISAAAHELKNPLTSAIGYSEMIKVMINKNKPVSKNITDNLHQSLIQLKTLISQFLEVDNIKKGLFTYSLKRMSLGKLVHFSIQNFRHRNPDRQMIIDNRLAGPLYIKGDKIKLLQVIANLLNNAHKFSPPHKPITIILDQLDNHGLIQIIDEGIGITPKHLPKIFDKYYTGTDNQAGFGLGLFLVKNIIDKHNGKIDITSEVNHGTTVTLTLPII